MSQQYSQKNVVSALEPPRTRGGNMLGEQRPNFTKGFDAAMRDCVADWCKWGPIEQVLAVVVALLIVSAGSEFW